MRPRWAHIANLASGYETPFFLIWSEPFLENKNRLQRCVKGAGNVRQWYSFKTQPVLELAAFAGSLGMGIEVVSKRELAAALHLNFRPEDILVNGVAKHNWLNRETPRLNVIFDSLHELGELAPAAASLNWRCGLRVAVSQQINVDIPDQPPQFGIGLSDLGYARDLLAAVNLPVRILHFHLHSNVPSARMYNEALLELRDAAIAFGMSPDIIDIGGGLPDWTLDPAIAEEADIRLKEYGDVLRNCEAYFKDLSEIWLENGRHLLGPSAVLVVTVQDVKIVDGVRVLICDGGRTNQALPSVWENHNVSVLASEKSDDVADTVVCGPTCMGYDSLYRGLLPALAKIGDRLIYFNAGAYHIPWENRFSHGLCKILWTTDGATFRILRPSETSEDWLLNWSVRTTPLDAA
jgi:diaminopimelate decarboxylase